MPLLMGPDGPFVMLRICLGLSGLVELELLKSELQLQLFNANYEQHAHKYLNRQTGHHNKQDCHYF